MADEATPSLQAQTIALGKMLKAIADEDPAGTPTPRAAAAFFTWMDEAGPGSREPRYFNDVVVNFDVARNSNKDIWEMFDILENYIEVDDEEEADAAAPRTFISLPLAS